MESAGFRGEARTLNCSVWELALLVVLEPDLLGSNPGGFVPSTCYRILGKLPLCASVRCLVKMGMLLDPLPGLLQGLNGLIVN